MNMIERVARALCFLDGSDPDAMEAGDAFGIDGCLPNGDPAHMSWKRWENRAVEVLQLIKNPTECMLEVGSIVSGRHSYSEAFAIYQAMITAALEE